MAAFKEVCASCEFYKREEYCEHEAEPCCPRYQEAPVYPEEQVIAESRIRTDTYQ